MGAAPGTPRRRRFRILPGSGLDGQDCSTDGDGVMSEEKKGLGANTGDVPIDLNAGMIEAVTNPPPGFVSKHKFQGTDLASRLTTINWFAHCGERSSLDLSMETVAVTSWQQAITSCKSPVWENVELEAQNQLTLWLHLHDHANYQKWNEIVVSHKNAVVNHLAEQTFIPFQTKNALDIVFVHCVQWDILGALMENSYLGNGHRAFFFLELSMIYEAGHFPCGWEGDWPQGKLCVY
jgi:hypothetical protein